MRQPTPSCGASQAEAGRLTTQLTEQGKSQTAAVQNVRQELRQTGTDVRNELKAEAERLAAELAAESATQSTNLQTLRQELQQADEDLHTTLKNELDGLNTQIAEHESSQKTTLQNLRQELRKANSDLREELRLLSQRLTDEKTDRAMLGDLFVELGNHVKTGGSLADMLNILDQPS